METPSLYNTRQDVDAPNSVNIRVTGEGSLGPTKPAEHCEENIKLNVIDSEAKLPCLEPDMPDISGNAEQANLSTVKPVHLITVLRYPQKSEQTEEEIGERKDGEIRTKRRVRKRKRKDSGERKPMGRPVKYPKDPLEDDKSIGMPLSGETVCPICAESFDAHEQLEAHVRKTGHYERNWMCKLCNKRFLLLKSLRYHIKSIHEKMTRDHIRCGKEFDPNENYEVNLRETFLPHLEDTLPCGICGKLFKGKCMEFHLKTHVGIHWKNGMQRIRKCRHCSLYFATPSDHGKHVTQVHNDFFQCELCGENFYARTTLKLHKIRIHGEDSDIKCNICGVKFARPDQLRNHMTTHTSSRPEHCKICGKTFKNRTFLCFHVNVKHNVSLKNIDETIEMMKNGNETTSTTDDKPMVYQNKKSDGFLCTICGKVIKGKHKSYLKQHISRVHSTGKKANERYPCEKCGKSFKDKVTLRYHLEYHWMEENPNDSSAEAKFMCPVCGKGFRIRGMFLRHKNGHKKQIYKFVQCDICGITVQDRTMQDHLDNHAGVLKFECEKCGKMFASRGRLYNHRMVHKNVNYQCEVCGASYKQKSYLKRHIKNKHSQ